MLVADKLLEAKWLQNAYQVPKSLTLNISKKTSEGTIQGLAMIKDPEDSRMSSCTQFFI